MNYYRFKQGTGELQGARQPQIDPVATARTGRTTFCGPARNETTDAPPPGADGHAIIYRGEAWRVVRDCRGETWFEGEQPVVVDFFGDPADLGYTRHPVRPLGSISMSEIDAERDRRMQSCAFAGSRFDIRADNGSLANIAIVTALAADAVARGAQSGDVYWLNPDVPFEWMTEANELARMDARTALNFGRAVVEHRRRIVFAARRLKDMRPIPEDITAEMHW